jgi:hypothetical protein
MRVCSSTSFSFIILTGVTCRSESDVSRMCASAWCDQCSQSCVMCEEVNPTPQKNSSPTPHFSSMAQVARGVGGVDVGAPQRRLIALSMSLGCRAPVHLYSVILRTMTSASQDVGLWRERVAQEQAAALRASPLDPRHLRTTRECRLRMEIELALRADPRLRRPSQQSPRKGPPQLAPRSSHRTKPDAPSPRVSSTPRNLGVQVCDSS